MRPPLARAAFHCTILSALLATVTAWAADTPPETVGPGLETIMANLHAVKSASAHFVERKTIRVLTRTLTSSGTLRYTAPDMLEKLTTTPFTESFILNGDLLSGTRKNGDNYSVTLSDHAEVATLVEGIRSTLAGDLPTLSRYYTIQFTGDNEDWHLNLTPKNRVIRDKVDRILIDGSDIFLKTIEIKERDGDRSQMTVTPDSP